MKTALKRVCLGLGIAGMTAAVYAAGLDPNIDPARFGYDVTSLNPESEPAQAGGASADFLQGYADGLKGVTVSPGRGGKVTNWGSIDPFAYSQAGSDYAKGVAKGLKEIHQAPAVFEGSAGDGGIQPVSAPQTAAADEGEACKGEAQKVPGFESLSTACKAIAEEAACAKGSKEERQKARDALQEKFLKAECLPPEYDTPTGGVAAAGAPEIAPATPQTLLDTARQAAGAAMGEDLGAALTGGMGNLNLQQMMQQALLQQLLANGGMAGNGNGGGEYPYTDDPTADDACDRIEETRTTSSTVVVSGTTTTTIVATATCANGLSQTVTQVIETKPDGTTTTTTTTD